MEDELDRNFKRRDELNRKMEEIRRSIAIATQQVCTYHIPNVCTVHMCLRSCCIRVRSYLLYRYACSHLLYTCTFIYTVQIYLYVEFLLHIQVYFTDVRTYLHSCCTSKYTVKMYLHSGCLFKYTVKMYMFVFLLHVHLYCTDVCTYVHTYV